MGKLQDDVRIDKTLKEVIQMPTQADLAGGATLANVITGHNDLLAKLRAAGLLK